MKRTDIGTDLGRGLCCLYLDNHLLAVAKPAGLLAQADRTGDTDVLTLGKAFLKERFDKPGAVYLGLVHRLDRPVSGVMVLARTSKAAARLSEQFRQRRPTKRYAALVEGRVARELDLEHYIRKEQPKVRVYDRPREGAQRARLRAKPVWTDGAATLLDVRLETGRPHQVRAQLSRVGCPLVGDGRYGAKTPPILAPDGGASVALHAYALEVEHPTLREPVVFVAETPAAWPKAARDAVGRLAREAGK